MSLIYRALRKQGSETRATTKSRSGLWERRPEAALQPGRPVFLWWLLAGALSLATVAAVLALVQSDAQETVDIGQSVSTDERSPAARTTAELTQGPASDRSSEPTPQLIEVAAKHDGGIYVTSGPAAGDLPVDALGAAPALATVERQLHDTETAPVTSHVTYSPSNKPPQAIRVSDSAYRLGRKVESRDLMQARARERIVEMTRLTADLTRAARARNQPETERLLNQIESKTGVRSNYSLNMRAYVALVNGQYAEAETLLGVVLVRNQTDADAGLNMAVAESQTGRLEQARRRLERLALVHPDDDRIRVMLQSFRGR